MFNLKNYAAEVYATQNLDFKDRKQRYLTYR